MSKQNVPDEENAAQARTLGLWRRQSRMVVALALLMCLGFGTTAAATNPSSSNYSVSDTQFGTGASLHDCSTNYCAKTSVGDTTVGNASSDNYSAQTGANTTDEPLLEVTANSGFQDLGTLDVGTTGTATFTVGVRSYLSNGYVMQLTGSPPSQGRHALTALTTPDQSIPGTEQFGVNLVANNTPNIGADPVQNPSNQISFGVVTSNYIVPNFFKYEEGDVVAESSTSTGQTVYTVSMILNVSNLTPAGRYIGKMSAVVVPLY